LQPYLGHITLADSSPGEGFVAVAPDLEDVYFGRLRAQATARAA
jgi:hypothetical protein